jgi:peptidoglycan/xylan/chitin deacetylase (PgdA/CDA1 family)
MYHRVGDNSAEAEFSVSTRSFERQMRAIKTLSYHVVELDEIMAALDGKAVLPEKSIAITFDDGFRDTLENAEPVLRSLGYAATFFLVSRLMGGTNAWMVGEKYSRADLMSWTDARELSRQGFTIGSHSRTHRSLNQLRDAEINDEVEGSKRDLEDKLGTTVRYFAYPYGHLDNRSRNAVERAGYAAACSTRSGFNNSSTDRYGLRRLEINRRDSMRMFLRSLTFGQNHMRMTQELRYYFRRALGLTYDEGASFGA